MKRFKRTQKRSAQQLIEFLLVAPFMIIILGILIEYAYALNVNMTINQGLKEVTSLMYADIKPNMPVIDIQASVLTELETYLDDNNIPVEAKNNLGVKYLTLGNTTVFTATYKYIPAFTLPTVYFKFIPDELNFFAASAVPTAFLNPNNYGSGLTTGSLNGVWAGQKGVMNDATKQSKILFLIENTIPKYKTMNWNGAWDSCVVDTSIAFGVLSGGGCASIGKRFQTYLTDNGYTNVIFVHDSSGDPWGDVRGRAIALANKDINKTSLGNYDMSPSGSYKTAASGANVFTYMSATGLTDNITNLK